MRHNFKTIVDSLTVPTFVIDIDHNVIAWNRACELLTGINASEIIGTKDAWRGFYSSERPCLANVVLDNNKQQLEKYYPLNGLSKFSKGLHAENWFENMNGKKRYLIFDAEPIYDEQDGSLIGALENLEDVTEMKQVALRERTHSEVMAQLIDGSPLNSIFNSLIEKIEDQDPFARCSILLLDPTQKYLVTTASPSLPDFYNHEINQLKISVADTSQGLESMFSTQRVIVSDVKTDPLWRQHRSIASVANIGSCWSEPITNRDDTFLGVFVIYYDRAQTPSQDDIQFLEFASKLTTLAIEQNILRQQQQLSSRVFNGTLEGITITNSDGIIIDINPAFTAITGYSRDDVIGSSSSLLTAGSDGQEFDNKMWQSLNKKGHWQGELWNRKKDGELYAELLSITSLKNDQGDVMNYVAVFSDITETKQQQEKLNLMAHYDVLTKLPNRVLFLDRFKQAIAHSKRSNTLLALIFLDLDEFKPVNDTFGHDIGDKLLIEVAARIKQTIRDEDTVSRQGGDEFAILIGDINSVSECEHLATRIHKELSKPYNIENNTIVIGASSGLILYPTENADIDTLIRYADQAMYQAKLHGRNQFHLFSHVDSELPLQKQSQRLEIERALEQDQLQLYYQPKVNMRSGELYGFEALIRWIHPEKGLIPPLEFLPLIDGTDLEIKVGNWVITQALQQLEQWNKQSIDVKISINISSHHILSASFYDTLKSALARHASIDSQDLQLEILESSALSDITAISHIIESCQEKLGVKVALDDFGTGYSSLAHLRNLPANTIKIDRSFVRDMLEDPSDAAIIDGIIGLANAFNRGLIAEGVESTKHGIMLMLMGCQNAQGYGIAKPMPTEEIADWITNYKPNKDWVLYGELEQTTREDKIQLFKLVTDYWFEQFESTIHSDSSTIANWPIMSKNRCHCGSWIKRARQENLFSLDSFSQLDQYHETMHMLAEQIKHDYQIGNLIPARKLLPLLTKILNDMYELVTRKH